MNSSTTAVVPIDEGNEWSLVKNVALKLVAAYLPLVSCAVCASDRNVRAMAELHGPVRTHRTLFTNAEGLYKEEEGNATTTTTAVGVRTHVVQFVYPDSEDDVDRIYADCVVDVGDVRAVEHAVWWLQVVGVRALRLEGAGCLSAHGLQRVLAALLTEQPPLTAAGSRLTAVLEELTCNGTVSNYPVLPEDMKVFAPCAAMRRIQMHQCCHPDSLVGLEKLTALEALQITYTNVSDLTPLRSCHFLQTLDLRGCRQVRSLAGLEDAASLVTLILSGTSIDDLTLLHNCQQLTNLDLNGCTHLHSLAGLERLQMLQTLFIYCTGVNSLKPLQECRRLSKLDLRFAWELHTLTGLEESLALKEVMLSSMAKNVDTSAIPPNRKHLIKYY